LSYPQEYADIVNNIIQYPQNASTSVFKNITSQMVQDADRLRALGATGFTINGPVGYLPGEFGSDPNVLTPTNPFKGGNLIQVVGRFCQNNGHCEDTNGEFVNNEEALKFMSSKSRQYAGWNVEIEPHIEIKTPAPKTPGLVFTLPYTQDSAPVVALPFANSTTSTPSATIALLAGLWMVAK
jgi:hypothetical protein